MSKILPFKNIEMCDHNETPLLMYSMQPRLNCCPGKDPIKKIEQSLLKAARIHHSYSCGNILLTDVIADMEI